MKQTIHYLIIAFLALTNYLEGKQSSPPKAKYVVSICSIFKNEAKNLKEWIEFHRLIGVDHFYLYNIDSKDNYLEVLNPYIKQKLVTLIQWPNTSKNHEHDDALTMLGTQIPAYENAAYYLALKESKWLVFIDVDEFLVPPTEEKITDLLNRYDQYPGVILASDFFNASELFVFPKRNLVIENTELSFPPSITKERTVEKTIFKPTLIEGFSWAPYRLHFKEEQQPITIKKQELRINHYINKNSDYIFYGKVKEKFPIDAKYLSEGETNLLLEKYEIRETSITRFIPEVRKRMGFD